MEFSDEVMGSVVEDLHALGYDATSDGTGFRVRLGFGYGVRVKRHGGLGWVEGSAAAILAVGIVGMDVYRYVLTESAMVTIRYLLVSRY